MISKIVPFSISINKNVINDFKHRIQTTRWPDQIPGIGWEQGTELNYLRELLSYCESKFDWYEQEKKLNQLPHFQAYIDGTKIHFIHTKAKNGNGIPLVLTHGIQNPSFDLVIPSLPGYGFSERPLQTGVNYRRSWADTKGNID